MKRIILILIIFAGITTAQVDTLFYDGFEEGLVNWTPVNLADPSAPTLWRTTNSRFVSPNHSAAWNDSVTNSYPHNLYQAIDSPPISIPLNARTFIKFKAFIHLTLNGLYYHDYFFVRYTTNNGNTWNNFTPNAVSGQLLNWRSYPEDFGPTASGELTYFAGKTMRFRIIARSDELEPNGIGIFVDDFFVYSQSCDFIDENEPNNNIATATQIELGDIVHASLCPQNDEDFYKFTAQQGDVINFVTQHSISWTYLYLMNSNGFTILNAYNEFTYTATYTGIYYVRVIGSYNHSANYSLYLNNRPEPDIIAVTDIPEDQGLKVRVKWQASFYDPQTGNSQIKEYQLWRKINDTLSLRSTENNSLIKRKNPVSDGVQEEYWEHIVTVPALSNRPFVNYSYVSPTLRDSLLTTFIIAAVPKNETQPIVWGEEGSGYSVDNVSPGFDSFSASHSGNGIKLNWFINTSQHPDIEKIEIFKGIYDIFPPVIENRIAQPGISENNFIDYDLLNGYTYYYIIAVSDFAGNITYSPVITTGMVTSVEGTAALPDEFSLSQNYPNPFNPVTTITFALPSAANVSLKVYDITGKEVAELTAGNFTPGTHDIRFDASELSSGIYFYTLSGFSGSEHFRQTKKLMLIK